MRLRRQQTFRARELRRASTPAEQVLWELLRSRRLLHAKFRRQVPLGPYFADFFCAAAALVVELDGAHHFPPPNHDRFRDQWLAMAGIAVLRLPNALVVHQPRQALNRIAHALRVRLVLDLPPLPPGEGDRGGEGDDS